MLAATLFTPNIQREPDFYTQDRVSSILAAINSCSPYSKDEKSCGASERKPFVITEASKRKSRPKLRKLPRSSRRSLTIAKNIDGTNESALRSTNNNEVDIKGEKTPAVVKAENIRIETMDPGDPRYYLPVPARNLHPMMQHSPNRNSKSEGNFYYDESWDGPTVIVRAEDIRIELMDPSDPRNNLPVPTRPRNLKTRRVRDPAHETMNWTFCYDDYCPIHMSEKDGKGYYPSAPY